MENKYIPDGTFKLYKGSVTIEFYEKHGKYKHVYINKETGEWLKSVSTATGVLNKPALVPWACKIMAIDLIEKLENGGIDESEILKSKSAWRGERDKSADKGTIAHDLISDYVLYKLGRTKKMPKMSKDKDVNNCYIAFREWETKHKVKFIDTECLVYSKKYNFVGRLDCIAEVDGEYCLIDFKTGNGIYWDYVLQVSGYGQAHEEEHKKKFHNYWIVRLGKDNAEFEAKGFKPSPKLKKGFLSCHYLASIQKDVEQIIK